MEPEQKSNGALVGSIIIITILVIGGIYFWKTNVERNSSQTPVEENNMGDFESSYDMEADLNNIDVESTDQGI